MLAAVLAVVLWISLRKKKITKRVALTVLLPYLFLVLISTIIIRPIRASQHPILRPFWTIQSIVTGGKQKAWLAKELIMNFFMLMLVGRLAPVLFEEKS